MLIEKTYGSSAKLFKIVYRNVSFGGYTEHGWVNSFFTSVCVCVCVYVCVCVSRISNIFHKAGLKIYPLFLNNVLSQMTLLWSLNY
jgi:hypothetical protein